MNLPLDPDHLMPLILQPKSWTWNPLNPSALPPYAPSKLSRMLTSSPQTRSVLLCLQILPTPNTSKTNMGCPPDPSVATCDHGLQLIPIKLPPPTNHPELPSAILPSLTQDPMPKLPPHAPLLMTSPLNKQLDLSERNTAASSANKQPNRSLPKRQPYLPKRQPGPIEHAETENTKHPALPQSLPQ